MVREHSVGLEELTSSDICAESLKYVCGIESAYAVACVNNDPEALKGMMVIVV